MSAERHIFHTTVTRIPLSILVEIGAVVILRLFKQRCFWIDNPEDSSQDGEPALVTEVVLHVNGSAKELLCQHLLNMGVPVQEHKNIFLKFLCNYVTFDGITNAVPYTVNMLDISVSLLGSANYREIVDWVGRQTIVFEHPWGPKFIPASRSWINSLKSASVDTLEADCGSCSICLIDFTDCIDRLVTMLPCKHCYHADCIRQSLETGHRCPLCRQPMPTVEAGSKLLKSGILLYEAMEGES